MAEQVAKKYLNEEIKLFRISIKEYAKKHVKCNPDENLNDVISRLKDAVKRKNSGATCSICGSSI